MITPPRFLESVLSALGAAPEYRDLVVGDLAEELALRASYDGAPAARRWYRREALRSIPHLLGNAMAQLGMKGVRHVLGVVLTAWIVVGVAFGTSFSIVFTAFQRVWPEYLLALRSGPLWVPAVFLPISLGAFVGGYIAAALDRRSPLVSAGALGVLWGAADLLTLISGIAGPVPLLYNLAVPTVVCCAAIAGGLARLRSHPPEHTSTSTDAAY